MRGLDQLLYGRLLDSPELDMQLHLEAVTSGIVGRDAHFSRHGECEKAAFCSRATAFSTLWKQAAYPDAKSCSGFVWPPTRPSPWGMASSTSIRLSDDRV